MASMMAMATNSRQQAGGRPAAVVDAADQQLVVASDSGRQRALVKKMPPMSPMVR